MIPVAPQPAPRWHSGFSASLAILLAVLWWPHASGQAPTIHACIGADGFTFVKPGTTCPDGQTLTQLPSNGTQGLTVKDANGNRVGDVEGFNTSRQPLVVIRAGGRIFTVTATQTRLLGSMSLMYTSTDCSGEAYVHSLALPAEESASLLPTAAGPVVSGGTMTFHFASMGEGTRTLVMRSSRQSDQTCVVDPTTSRTVYPTTTVTLNLSAPFTIE